MGLELDGVNGIIKNTTSDGDVTIKGNDGGSEISLLAFDVSAEGVATFNSKVGIKDSAPDVLLHVNQGGEPPAEGMFILEANSASRQLRIQPPTNSDNGFIDYRGGNLTFLDDGTEVARFQGTTGFGIGESSPLGKLHVKTADSGASVDSNADELVVEGSGSSGISILSGTGNEGAIKFGDSGDNNIAFISYDHAGNDMYIGTNAATRVKVHDNGVAAFNNGVALGVGTANTASNVLDDYEEGTFSPSLSGASGAPSGVNYSIRTGSYTKIGRLVTCHIYLALSSWSSGPSGDGIITALPFTVRNDNDSYAAANIAYADGFISSDAPQTGYAVINTTKINLQTNQSSDSRDDLRTPVNAGNFSGDETIIITCSYHTDS
jgi:hypothetical protein